METHPPSVLDPAASALLVVDIQERFRAAMAAFEEMLSGSRKLVTAFRSLGLPILVTEQYPKGLGRTVPEILQALGEPAPGEIGEKTTFSSFGCAGVPERLARLGTRSVLVCGIETHVCVHQSVQDLLAAGYKVHVAADAVGSRRAFDRESALRRMERSGAVVTTCEMACFELLRDARHPKFKDVQALFK
ncbi:MAG TPA: hydrolase [Planctomycetota bacterium]|jgi:nicotinamidase-related amidase|nr:hydrolase [Planctomycetota bacterium]